MSILTLKNTVSAAIGYCLVMGTLLVLKFSLRISSEFVYLTRNSTMNGTLSICLKLENNFSKLLFII